MALWFWDVIFEKTSWLRSKKNPYDVNSDSTSNKLNENNGILLEFSWGNKSNKILEFELFKELFLAVIHQPMPSGYEVFHLDLIW